MSKECNLIVGKDYKGNGTQLLTMPNGEVIPGQVWSRVYTGIDEPAYAIVKLLINVGNTSIESNAKEVPMPIKDFVNGANDDLGR